MVNTNIEWLSMSDSAIVDKIGEFIKSERLKNNKTQAQLANEAGLNRWTVSQIENGEAISMISLIQIMRALGVLHLLDIFAVKQTISPIQLAKLEQQKRQRVRNADNGNKNQSDW